MMKRGTGPHRCCRKCHNIRKAGKCHKNEYYCEEKRIGIPASKVDDFTNCDDFRSTLYEEPNR